MLRHRLRSLRHGMLGEEPLDVGGHVDQPAHAFSHPHDRARRKALEDRRPVLAHELPRHCSVRAVRQGPSEDERCVLRANLREAELEELVECRCRHGSGRARTDSATSPADCLRFATVRRRRGIRARVPLSAITVTAAAANSGSTSSAPCRYASWIACSATNVGVGAGRAHHLEEARRGAGGRDRSRRRPAPSPCDGGRAPRSRGPWPEGEAGRRRRRRGRAPGRGGETLPHRQLGVVAETAGELAELRRGGRSREGAGVLVVDEVVPLQRHQLADMGGQPPAELAHIAGAVEAGPAAVDVNPVDVHGQLHVLLSRARQEHPVRTSLVAI